MVRRTVSSQASLSQIHIQAGSEIQDGHQIQGGHLLQDGLKFKRVAKSKLDSIFKMVVLNKMPLLFYKMGANYKT